MIPAILTELDGIVDIADVTVLVATGTHRGNTADEIRGMLGEELAGRLRVVNHDARDETSLVWMGEHGDGAPVWLNRQWVGADVRITTGFVEPPFFAGFSGGPKMVAPGLETVLRLHDARRIGDAHATWAICEGTRFTTISERWPAAATVVAEEGTIIGAGECRDGFPAHGGYRQVLSSADSPAALLRVSNPAA